MGFFSHFLKSELCLGHPRITEYVRMETGETKAMALVASVGSASSANLSRSGIGTPWHLGPSICARLRADLERESRWHPTLYPQTLH